MITCPLLEVPVNGSIYYSKINGFAAIEFGATAKYMCNFPGLALSGGDSVRTCGPSSDNNVGQWSGRASTCERKQ